MEDWLQWTLAPAKKGNLIEASDNRGIMDGVFMLQAQKGENGDPQGKGSDRWNIEFPRLSHLLNQTFMKKTKAPNGK